LIRAFAKARQKYSELRLVLIGDGTARQSLEALAAELGVNDQVTFLGAVPFEEIPRYLKAADVFVFASVTETQGLVTIEAMAAGLPVVAVDGPGTRDIVQHGKQGILVENDPDALAKGLKKVLSSSELLKRLRNHALKKAKTFDINRLGKQMISVYEQAIEDKKADQYVLLKAEETAAPDTVPSAAQT
jgi:glycosyltransferase involved in cell wall biosynthesis